MGAIQQNINQLITSSSLLAGLGSKVYQDSPAGQIKQLNKQEKNILQRSRVASTAAWQAARQRDDITTTMYKIDEDINAALVGVRQKKFELQPTAESYRSYAKTKDQLTPAAHINIFGSPPGPTMEQAQQIMTANATRELQQRDKVSQFMSELQERKNKIDPEIEAMKDRVRAKIGGR